MIDKNFTFIKMDIEGAEYEALMGAEQIIRKHKPKLAICIYHNLIDYVRIPKLIYEYNADYRFYVRQHSIINAETVLYAI